MEPNDFCLLVVDDNEMNRDMLSRRLERKGYQVLVAEDGEAALALVEKEPIDLVLLDIMMPGIDGVEVLRRVRQTYSQAQLPVIMATAKADSDDMVEAFDLGANDYVTKPLDFPIVIAKVKKELRTKMAAKEVRQEGEPSAAELAPGAVLVGRYRLDQAIGSGTFGTVYRARHLELERDLALKVLHPSVTANEESMRRFRKEGQAASRLEHPSAVDVTDSGVSETGVGYLVMELLEGRSLLEELRAWKRLSPRRCLEILRPVCEVLAEAHEAHLVHRDIKPENIFLHRTRRGEVVKLLDFGIAKLVGEAFTEQNLTAEGWVLGTPAYMAPERLTNQGYDGRADVYGLGVMLFELITGTRPFRAVDGDPMSMIMMHVNQEPPTLRSVFPEAPEELEGVVARALIKNPDERPDARGLLRELSEVVARIDGTAPAAPPAAAPPPPGDSIDRDAPTTAFAPAAERAGFLGRLLERVKKPFS